MKMKDGRTRMGHKAEHALDLETGAIVAAVVYQPVEKRDLRRCASFPVDAAYRKYALFLEIRAPCISSFLNRLIGASGGGFSTG
ncbi:MAG: hypothetical protein ACLFOY_09695 [Desulfatibacillaceae bacterium]